MDFDKYKNTMKYPDRPAKPMLAKDAKPSDIRKHADAVEKYQAEEEKYKQARREYNEHEGMLINMFKQDALEDLGLTDHPKADLLYSKAYERGHSAGLNEVWQVMEDLAELLQ